MHSFLFQFEHGATYQTPPPSPRGGGVQKLWCSERSLTNLEDSCDIQPQGQHAFNGSSLDAATSAVPLHDTLDGKDFAWF